MSQNSFLPCLSDIRSIASGENIPESIEDGELINDTQEENEKHMNETQMDYVDIANGLHIMPQIPVNNKTIQSFPEAMYCTAIKIGSFEVKSFNKSLYLLVLVCPDCFFFRVPKAKGSGEVWITIKSEDLHKAVGNFTLSLRFIFLELNCKCADRIRYQLGMEKGDAMYYDPISENLEQRCITFIMTKAEELACHKKIVTYFIRTFPGSDLFTVERNTVEQEIKEKNLKTNYSLPFLSDVRSIASGENIANKKVVITPEQMGMKNINEVKKGCIEPSTQQNPVRSNKIRPFSKTLSVFCTAIKIGSFEVHPFSDSSCLFVLVSSDCFFFQVPKTKASGLASITLRKTDLKRVSGHFTLPLRFISLKTTPQCAKRIRSQLGMEEGDSTYYDPFGENVAQKCFTFVMDRAEDLMSHKRIVTYFMEIFPGLNLFNVEKDMVEQDMTDKNEIAQEYFQEVSLPEISESSVLLKLTSVGDVNHSLVPPASSPSSSISQNSASSKSVNLFCRSIRIGSYEVQPASQFSYLSVSVDNNSFAFKVPKILDRSTLVPIFLESHHITQFIGHFGCCLPLISLQTSVSCANKITHALNMQRGKTSFYDPKGTDETEKRITFMIDTSDCTAPCEEMERFLKKTTLANTLSKIPSKCPNVTTSVSTSSQVKVINYVPNTYISSSNIHNSSQIKPAQSFMGKNVFIAVSNQQNASKVIVPNSIIAACDSQSSEAKIGQPRVVAPVEDIPQIDQCDVKYLHELISKSIEDEIAKRYWLLKSKLVIEYFRHNEYDEWKELSMASPSQNNVHNLEPWSTEEDSLIYDAHISVGSNWCHVLPLLLPWRSRYSMKFRWGYLKQEKRFMDNQLKKDEDFLTEFKKEVHSTKWATLTKQLKEKIHLHYKNSLWTIGEVDSLYELYKKFGNRWNKIASHLPGRTGESIQKFENILKKFKELRQKFSSLHFQLNTSSANNNLGPRIQDVSNKNELIESSKNIPTNEKSCNNIDIKLENACDEIMDYVANNIKKEIISPDGIDDYSTTIGTVYSTASNCSESDIQKSTQNKKCLLCNPTNDTFEIKMADLVKMHKEICVYGKNKSTILDNVNNKVINSNCHSLLPEISQNSRKDETNGFNFKTPRKDLQSWSRKRCNIMISKKQFNEAEASNESYPDIASLNARCISPILRESTPDFEQNEINHNSVTLRSIDQSVLHDPPMTLPYRQIKEEPPDFNDNRQHENSSSFVPLPVKKDHYNLSAVTCSTSDTVVQKTSLEMNYLQEETSDFSRELLLSESHESFASSSQCFQVDIITESQKCSLSSVIPHDHSKTKTKSCLSETFAGTEANIPNVGSPSDSLPSSINDDESEDIEVMELSDDCGNNKQVFSKEEDRKLKELVDIYGVSEWKSIAKRFPDHNAIQCRKRWHKISKKSHSCTWTKEEDERLVNLVNKYGSKKFKSISNYFVKTRKECKKRWFNYLNPAIKNTPWTSAEETIVIQACKNWGRNWLKIASFLGDRKEIDIKRHWKSMRREKIENQELFSSEKSKFSLPECLKLEKCLKEKIAQETALQSSVSLTSMDSKTFKKKKIPLHDYEMYPNVSSSFRNISLKIKFGNSSIIVTGDKNSKIKSITSSFEDLSHQAVDCLLTEREGISELPNNDISTASTDEESVSSSDTVVYSASKSAKGSKDEIFSLTPVMDMKRKYKTIYPQSNIAESEKHLQNSKALYLLDAESFDCKILDAEKLLKEQIANGTAPEVQIMVEKLTKVQEQELISNSRLIHSCEVSTKAQLPRINCTDVTEPMLWSTDEDDKLEEIVNTYGHKWDIVAHFFPGRGTVECKHRWFTAVSPGCKKLGLQDDGQKITINQLNFMKRKVFIGQLKRKRKRHKTKS